MIYWKQLFKSFRPEALRLSSRSVFRNYVLVTILFLCVCSEIAVGQELIDVRVIGPVQGLSQSSVLSVHQDSLGFIWIATRDGLNMYDGNKITIYRNEPENPQSISGSSINDICDAPGGNVWLAHNKGLSLFDRRKEVFRNYWVGGLPDNEIRSIVVIDDNIWACGWTGVYVYDKRKDCFVRAESTSELSARVLSSSVSLIRKAPKTNELWIGTTTRGLFRYNTATDRMEHCPGVFAKNSTISQKERIEDILFHPNGKAYIATYGNGIYECDQAARILRKWTSETLSQTSINNIRSLGLDKDGRIWIGGFDGLSLLDPEQGLISPVSIRNESYILQNPSIRSLFVDRNASVWIGTYHDGLLLYDQYFARFRMNYISGGALRNSHSIVSAFAHCAGKLFVATENGLLLQYDERTGLSDKIEIRDKKGSPVVIKSLYYDEENAALWIGSLRNGLFCLRNKKVLSEGLEELGVINHINLASEGSLWLLSDRGGALNLYDVRRRELMAFPAQKALHALLASNKGKFLTQLEGKRFLLSSEGGGLILMENQEQGTAKQIDIGTSKVNHAFQHQGNIYVSTNGEGLLVLNSNLEVVRRYTTRDGLLNNIVHGIVSADEALWIACINGISRFSKQNGFENYYIKNGFPLSQLNGNLYYNPADGKILAGGKDAWLSFDPRRVYKNPFKPSIYISGIKVNNRPLSLHDEDLTELDLKYHETSLTLELVGLNYLMPENNSYRYKLEGIDNTWKYIGANGLVEYSRIPSGKYVFKAQASNNDGVWSDAVLELPVHVHPPFWLSAQAFVLYVLVLILTLWLLWRNALKRARLHHDLRIKELEKQRIDEQHRMKVKYFTDISHEIRTPLMLILSPVEEILEDEKLKPSQRKKIQNIQYHGNNLLQLVNQLLEINRIEMKKEKLEEVPVLLKNFLEKVNSSFASLAARNGIDWKADMSELCEEALFLDKKKIEKIVLNLLSNAMKYTPKGGQVSFAVRTIPDDLSSYTVYIDVEDTGIGIPAESLPYIFERFYKADTKEGSGSGIGLSLVKTIVEELLGGQIKVISTPEKGSKFSVVIPAVKSAAGESPVALDCFELPPQLSMDVEAEADSYVEMDTADKTYTVLLVEDNALLRNSLFDKLQKNFRVLCASSAEEAADSLQEEDIDLVVSDIMLPGKSGKELCAEMKSNILTSHIAVILLTAIQQEESKLESLELGADDYLIKPVSNKELYLRIMNILQRREQLRELYLKRPNASAGYEPRFNKYDNRLLEQIDEEIGKNLDNDAYSIEDLSRAVALSRVHLFRKMKKLLGISPSRYLRNFRLRKAVEILLVEDLRITELAYRVGFQDPNYFLKCFKELYGVSPGQYSKKLNEEAANARNTPK